MSEGDKSGEHFRKFLDNMGFMVTTDGPLLTANILLSALRRIAIRDLGFSKEDIAEGDEDPAIAETQGDEIKGLVLRLSVEGMRDLFAVGGPGFLDWTEIKEFVGKVASAAKTCPCPSCKSERGHES